MSIRLLDWRLRGALVEARIPFRFGIAEMKELLHAVLFVTVDVDGRRDAGVAADNLAPKWFTKNPETSYREDVREMIDVIESACSSRRAQRRRESVFDLWQPCTRGAASETRRVFRLSPLLAGFGVSFVERALIDAHCRADGRSVCGSGAREHPRSSASRHCMPGAGRPRARELLPTRPLTDIRIRHTVGLDDALAEGEDAVAPATACRRPSRPPSRATACAGSRSRWAAAIAISTDSLGSRGARTRHGRRLSGHARRERAVRGRAGAARRCGTSWSPEPHRRLRRRVEYVEQPLPAPGSGEETAAGLAAWPGRPRLIIDESDDSLDAVARALDAGYDGGAFKSSKGVFKGSATPAGSSSCDTKVLQAFVYSAEDLSTIGPVGLLADLAVIATLGIDEPERNGYHYLRDPTRLRPRVDEETLCHHGDLFAAHADGRAVLDIREGRIHVDSVIAAPFGVGWPCDIEEELASAESLLAAIR